MIEVACGPLAGSRLLSDYLTDHVGARPFFPLRFDRADDFRPRVEAAERRFDAAARAVAADLLRPTSPTAERRLDRFREQGGVMVTTGQQAGLFGGPIYTVVKAIAAVRLAAELEEVLARTVLPVFWVASDDHDWEEARHYSVVTEEGSVRTLSLPPLEGGAPVSDILLPTQIQDLTRDLRDLLGEIPAGLERAITAYEPGRAASEAFRDLLHALLADFDLCTVDAADPGLKRAAAPVLDREIAHRAEHERRLRERASDLLEAGYHVQVPVLERSANLFLLQDGRRERLEESPRGWLAPESGHRFEEGDLRRLLREHPGRFSPNVLLRPVVEAAVFPTIAYVGGPAEIAYLAQARPLFESLRVAQPVPVPRPSVQLRPPETGAALERLGLGYDVLDQPVHETAARLAERGLPAAATEALAGIREEVARGFSHLMEAAPEPAADDVTGPLGAARNRILIELGKVERRLRSAQRRADPDLLRDLALVYGHLQPLGAPQERAVGILPYLGRDGTALLDRIADSMDFGLARSVSRDAAGIPAD